MILAFVNRARGEDLNKYRDACLMWWARWTSATVARSVYRPPEHHRPARVRRFLSAGP